VGEMDERITVEDEIDWLTGEYTYKKEKLRNAIRRLENHD
jgi:hypothetical protein